MYQVLAVEGPDCYSSIAEMEGLAHGSTNLGWASEKAWVSAQHLHKITRRDDVSRKMQLVAEAGPGRIIQQPHQPKLKVCSLETLIGRAVHHHNLPCPRESPAVQMYLGTCPGLVLFIWCLRHRACS